MLLLKIIGEENVDPPSPDSENSIVPPPLFTNCVQLMYTRPLKVLFVIVSTARYGLSFKNVLFRVPLARAASGSLQLVPLSDHLATETETSITLSHTTRT